MWTCSPIISPSFLSYYYSTRSIYYYCHSSTIFMSTPQDSTLLLYSAHFSPLSYPSCCNYFLCLTHLSLLYCCPTVSYSSSLLPLLSSSLASKTKLIWILPYIATTMPPRAPLSHSNISSTNSKFPSSSSPGHREQLR